MTPLDARHTEEVRYMLDETRPAEHGTANGEPRTPGSNEPNTCSVDGPLSPARRLTVDFGGFVKRLEAVPALDHERLARYLTGVDLIHGLAGPPDAGFGRASPDVGSEAEISEQLAAITDEALRAAEDLLEAANTLGDDYYMAHGKEDRRKDLCPESPSLRTAQFMLVTDTCTFCYFSNISQCSSRVAMSFSSSWRHSALLYAGYTGVVGVRPGAGFGAISMPEAFSFT